MTLQKAVYFAVIGTFAMMMLSGIAMIAVISFGVVTSKLIDPLPFAISIIGFGLLKSALWFALRRLGGVPKECVRK